MSRTSIPTQSQHKWSAIHARPTDSSLAPARRAQTEISIIVPVRNGAGVIGRCVESVLISQDLDAYEIIIVDDGSTDGTWEAIAHLQDDRVRGFHQEHAGVSVARNTGATHALGTSITFLDSDDEALPGWLSRLSEELADPACGVVCCGVYDTVEARGSTAVRLPVDLGSSFYNQIALFLPGSYAVRTEIFRAVGGFLPEMTYGEHHELALRLIPHSLANGLRIAAIPRPLIRRSRPKNARKRLKGYRLSRYQSVGILLERHRTQLSKSPRRLSNHLANAGVSATGLGRSQEGRRLIFEAIKTSPRSLRNYGRLLISLCPPLARSLW